MNPETLKVGGLVQAELRFIPFKVDKDGSKGKPGMKLELVQLQLALSCPAEEFIETVEVDGPVLSSSPGDEIEIELPKKRNSPTNEQHSDRPRNYHRCSTF